MVNYLPNDLGEWVLYESKFRYKMMHDIMLNDGTIIKHCYPNADSWTVLYRDGQEHLTKMDYKVTGEDYDPVISNKLCEFFKDKKEIIITYSPEIERKRLL